MAAKDILFGNEARKQIAIGLNTLANTVKVPVVVMDPDNI